MPVKPDISPAHESRSRHHLRPLTSLRFFAAALVLVQHASYNLAGLLSPRFLDLFSNGYQAVSFFFVLSGFVLSYVYIRETAQAIADLSKRQFWIARFARIYPSYLLALVIAFPVFVYSVSISHTIAWPWFLVGLVTVPTLLQAWVPAVALCWNTPAWSLSVEGFFYACFPFLLRRTSTASAARFAFASLVAVLVIAILKKQVLEHLGKGITPGQHDFIAFFPPLFLPHFLFGMSVARVFLSRPASTPNWAEPLLFCSIVSISIIFTFHSSLSSWLISDAVLVPLFGILIYTAALERGHISEFLSVRPLVELGEASYALYIIHFPLLFWWTKTERLLGLVPLNGWSSFLLFCSFSICVSWVIWRSFELPFRRWLVSRLTTDGPKLLFISHSPFETPNA